MTGAPAGVLRSVLTGRVAPLGTAALRSAIAKCPRPGPVAVGALGLAGDEQADTRVHGGPDKALHVYPQAHYAAWAAEGAAAVAWQAGAFGENFSTEGVDEASVCIADRWRIGSAEFEVSQGRQPCRTLDVRFGQRGMAARVQNSLRTGWYLRVTQPGMVCAGDAIHLIARPHPGATLAWLLALIRDRVVDPLQIEPALALPLTASWRRLFEARLARGEVEDWYPRMGPG